MNSEQFQCITAHGRLSQCIRCMYTITTFVSLNLYILHSFFSNIVFTFHMKQRKLLALFLQIFHWNTTISPCEKRLILPGGPDSSLHGPVVSFTNTLPKITTISLDKNHSSHNKTHENFLRRIYSHKFNTENHSQSLCGQEKLRQRTQESRKSIIKFLE